MLSHMHLDPQFTDSSFAPTSLKLVMCVVAFISAFLSILYVNRLKWLWRAVSASVLWMKAGIMKG